MQLLTFVSLLGYVSMVIGAAFHPIQRRQDVQNLPEACGQFVTTVTETVTSPPATVTIALENPDQIAASISSALAIESTYLSDQSDLAPVSAPKVTTTHMLTFTEVIPVVEATLTSSPANSTGPYFVSVRHNTTDWSLTGYTPASSLTIGVTTVTLSPVPSTAASATTTINSTHYMTLTTRETDTSTIHSPFPLSTGGIFTGPKSYGWNSTSTFSVLASGASGSVSIVPIPNMGNATTITNLTIVLVTANVTAHPTGSASSTTTCSDETTYGYGFGSYASPSHYGTGLAKRQTCTIVSATIDGAVVTWCNNWDGSTVVPQTSFTTTFTPMPASQSTAPPASTEPASAPPSSTVTDTPVPMTPTSTNTGSPAAATTSCGVSGPFEINFDDLPAFSPSDNDTAPFPPIFNPYDHLWWSNGWSYVPPPNEPYPPQGGSRLAEYVPSDSTNSSTSGSPDAGDVPDGAVGSGPLNYDSAYWFNIASAYIGCDNGATDPSIICDFVATGYRYNPDTGGNEVFITEHFPQPPCANFQNCQLREIFFSAQFQGLSALSFYAAVQGQEKIFFIDTMEMNWWNNTCAAGLERGSHR